MWARCLAAILPFVLLLTACSPSVPFLGKGSQSLLVGPVHRVTQAPYIIEPYIAVDPKDPNHLVAIAQAAAGAVICPPGAHSACLVQLVLDASTDGGATWKEQPLAPQISGDGVVAFGPGGTLYEVGIWGQLGVFAHQGRPDGELSVADVQFVASANIDKPWLTVDHRTGALYAPWTGPTEGGRQGISSDARPMEGTPGPSHRQWRMVPYS